MIIKHAKCNNLDVVSSINFLKCQTILQKKLADIFLNKKKNQNSRIKQPCQ